MTNRNEHMIRHANARFERDERARHPRGGWLLGGLLLAGAAPALAQSPAQEGRAQDARGQAQQGEMRQGEMQRGQMQRGQMAASVIAPSRALLGANLKNPAGDDIGEVDDLLLDGRTGRVTHAIVSVGGFLGIGEKTVALPYESATWRPEEGGGGNFMSDISGERLEAMQEFDREAPLGRAIEAGAERVAGLGDEDAYAHFFEGGETQEVEGEIRTVEGADARGAGEGPMIVNLGTERDQARRVLLAPMSFLRAHGAEALAAGTRVSAQVVRADDARGELWVARSVQVDGKELELRNERGQALWTAPETLLASELDGRRVLAGEREVGEARSVLIDTTSGEVAFVVVGVDDGRVAIPMQALRVQHESFALTERAVQALATAPRLSGDPAEELSDPQRRSTLREAFGVARGDQPSRAGERGQMDREQMDRKQMDREQKDREQGGGR